MSLMIGFPSAIVSSGPERPHQASVMVPGKGFNLRHVRNAHSGTELLGCSRLPHGGGCGCGEVANLGCEGFHEGDERGNAVLVTMTTHPGMGSS